MLPPLCRLGGAGGRVGGVGGTAGRGLAARGCQLRVRIVVVTQTCIGGMCLRSRHITVAGGSRF